MHAQFSIHPSQTAATLAADLIDSAVVITDPVLTCDSIAEAVFIGGDSSSLGMLSGILLSTGLARTSGFNYGVDGPATNFASTSFATPGDSLLTIIAGGPTFDACVLEFDVTPTWDTLLFNYIFGSEEYTSFTCSPFNDVFGFFITGPEYTTPTNIAIVPGTTIPVAINTINCGPSAGYTISTCNAMGAGAPFCDFYVNNVAGTSIAYDGYTTPLTAKAAVTAGATYHLRLGVADVSDDVYDSGVFLEGGSLHSKHGSGGPTELPLSSTEKTQIAVSPNPFNESVKADVPAAYNNMYLTCHLNDVSGNQAFEYKGVGSGLAQALQSASARLRSGIYMLSIEVPQTKYKQIMKIQKQ